MSIVFKTRWWGFLDELGEITVAQYKNDKQIEICEAMPFVKGIFEVFDAWDKVDALHQCKQKLQQVEYHDKGIH